MPWALRRGGIVAADLRLRFNVFMDEILRERAFKQDLFLGEIWSDRFFSLMEKKLDLKNANSVSCINAGTGQNCFSLAERTGNRLEITGVCESAEHLKIARDKAAALKSPVTFCAEPIADRRFDIVIADASLTLPEQIPMLFRQIFAALHPDGKFVLVTAASGSFSEIFSLLWEVRAAESGEYSGEVENLIAGLPKLDSLIEEARKCGLAKIEAEVATEVFEYERPDDFTQSPLFADFLLPQWLSELRPDEMADVRRKISRLIEKEYGDLPFRFQVKAAVISGEGV